MKYHAVLRMMLKSLHTIHGYWNRPSILTASELSHYLDSITLLTKTWTVLAWKPTVWVHWVCAHSGFYMATYRCLFSFSSIPTEHRHQKFKMDLRHAFEGWKFAKPHLTKRWLTRVVDLDALVQDLRVYNLTQSDNIFPKNKRRKLE